MGFNSRFKGLRQVHILRVFENRVLRKTFGHKRKEIVGDWIISRDEELYDLYCSPNIVRVIKAGRTRQVGHGAGNGERRGAYRVLVWKPLRKRLLGKPGCK